MNKEKQRIAIAEACGWTGLKESMGYETRYRGTPSETAVWVSLPDYLYDLNAMHEAEKVLTDEQMLDYLDALLDVLGKNIGPGGLISTDSVWQMTHATATQRAEAFLKGIGKWVE
jgi:hypothetical protein